MKTLADILADGLQDRLNKPTSKESGFFDLPKQEICNSPEHEAPKHIHIPQGKGYRHVCPKCGRIQTIIPQQISF